MSIKEIILGFIKANITHYQSLVTKRKVYKNKDIDVLRLYEKTHFEASPVFVLSTGRTGTLFLTNILNQLPKTHVEHEPKNELLYYSKYAFENRRTKSDEIKLMIDASRYETIRNCFLNEQTYIETNNRITFFAYELAQLYPNAKFIHLVRPPVEFIKSGLNREWYSGNHLHDEGRITHQSKEVWDGFSDEEKIAWLWNETNQFIEDFKTSIAPDRHLTVISNKMYHSKQIQHDIVKFIGLDTFDYKEVKQVNKQKNRLQYEVDELKIASLLTVKKRYDFN